ncbi:MAG TPA: potassium transporter Kup [Rectinemataceae bacterium]|nr:potassium transporter Kup [Rectinemataceae bacterium]
MENNQRNRDRTLAIAALGIVFGDIGTSPLYALRECFAPEHGVDVTRANVLGIVSLLIWSLSLIVCVKYVAIVLRADNKGEGGILALVSLVGRNLPRDSKRRAGLIATLGIIGAALLLSDGMITPAISVLSAVEGLRDVTPSLGQFVIPISLVVLVLLFPFQSGGTAKVGRVFGPIVILWFAVLAILGLVSIAGQPGILAALDPRYAIDFVRRDGMLTFGVLGSIFLAMTGAEVLYADLGHFGRRPIRMAWFGLVYPALMLNYIGQGAWLLGHPEDVSNLFYRIAPQWLGLPLVVLATAATIIASQAVISGAFSIARQSVQLGYWPRIQVRHTSDETVGQVYVPIINWFLLVGTIGLVLGFKRSGNLANAYGIAVSATMFITTSLMIYVTTRIWKKGLWYLIPLEIGFLLLEAAFVVSNLGKIASGGWFVVALAVVIFALMKTWLDGRKLFGAQMRKFHLSPAIFASSIALNPPIRIPGTAVFLTANPDGVPKALLHSLKHYRVLHARTIILSVETFDIPRVEADERYEVRELEADIWQVQLRFGFSESPDIPRALRNIPIPAFSPDAPDLTYFVGKESLFFAKSEGGMPWLRKRIFGFMFSNAQNATDFFKLPTTKIIELGGRTQL